jgi:putative Ca2+/H+ antiporter (TMEM165/GDT1 family)
MDGVGPSEELQEVEEELRKSKGDGKEQGEDGDECDIVGSISGGEGDVEKGNVGVSKLSKQNVAAENLKVFTQVITVLNPLNTTYFLSYCNNVVILSLQL